MDSFLLSDAWKELRDDYSLAVGEAPRHCIRTLELSALLDAEPCRAYVEWLMGHIGSASLSVASSMLVKRVAYLLVAPLLGAMTYYNQGIGVRPEHCHLFHPGATPSGTAFPFMTLSRIKVTAPEANDRETWRAGIVKQVFADGLTPLMKNLVAMGSVSMATLWENVMVRIAPVFSYDEGREEKVRQRMQDDFLFIAMNAPGELFGMRKNPFASFTEQREGGRIAGRSKRLTCCLYYQMAPEYCLKCPKL